MAWVVKIRRPIFIDSMEIVRNFVVVAPTSSSSSSERKQASIQDEANPKKLERMRLDDGFFFPASVFVRVQDNRCYEVRHVSIGWIFLILPWLIHVWNCSENYYLTLSPGFRATVRVIWKDTTPCWWDSSHLRACWSLLHECLLLLDNNLMKQASSSPSFSKSEDADNNCQKLYAPVRVTSEIGFWDQWSLILAYALRCMARGINFIRAS